MKRLKNVNWNEAIREYIQKKNKEEECNIAESILMIGKIMKRVYGKCMAS